MTTKTPSGSAALRQYRAPELTEYGSFAELTAAGSGTQGENISGQGSPNRFP